MKIHSLFLSSILVAGAFTLQAGTAENWDKNCAKCHGADGKGNTKMGKKAGVKDMTSADYQANLKDDAAVKAIREGLKENGKEKMKANNALSDAEIKDLVAHVRKFKQ